MRHQTVLSSSSRFAACAHLMRDQPSQATFTSGFLLANKMSVSWAQATWRVARICQSITQAK
jgi:hypothetical protein